MDKLVKTFAFDQINSDIASARDGSVIKPVIVMQ